MEDGVTLKNILITSNLILSKIFQNSNLQIFGKYLPFLFFLLYVFKLYI